MKRSMLSLMKCLADVSLKRHEVFMFWTKLMWHVLMKTVLLNTLAMVLVRSMETWHVDDESNGSNACLMSPV